jgi:hypothetical protein
MGTFFLEEFGHMHFRYDVTRCIEGAIERPDTKAKIHFSLCLKCTNFNGMVLAQISMWLGFPGHYGNCACWDSRVLGQASFFSIAVNSNSVKL